MSEPKPQESTTKPEAVQPAVGGLGGQGGLGGLPPAAPVSASPPAVTPKPQAGTSTPPMGWKPTPQTPTPGWKPTPPANIAQPFKKTLLDEPTGPEPTPEQLVPAREALWQQLATTDLLMELKKAALAAHSDEDLSGLKFQAMFEKVTSLNEAIQNTFTLTALELGRKRRCDRSEKMLMNMAVEAVALARVAKTIVNPLEQAKRDAGMSKTLGVTPAQLRSGKGIVTYPGVVNELVDDPRFKAMLSSEVLLKREVSNPAYSADEMRKAGTELVQNATAIIGGRGDKEALVQTCFMLVVMALIVVWDLRMWWALGGAAGLDERVKAHRKQQQVQARAQRKGRKGQVTPDTTTEET